MNSRDARLSRLEEKRNPGRWLYVVCAPEGEDDLPAFLQSQGHEVGPQDLVVQLTRFASGRDGLELISAQETRS